MRLTEGLAAGREVWQSRPLTLEFSADQHLQPAGQEAKPHRRPEHLPGQGRPAEAGVLLGAPWWTTEPTTSDRTSDFERLSWTPVERDVAHLTRLEATLASPDFSGELEFQWFALVDRRRGYADSSE